MKKHMLVEKMKPRYSVSQSFLKEIQKSPDILVKKLEPRKSSGFKLGTVVDAMLTDPGKIDESIVIYSGSIPKTTSKMHTFVMQMVKGAETGLPYDLCIQEAYDEAEYSITLSKVVDTFNKPENKEYYDFCLVNKGKIILTQEEYDLCEQIHKNLRTNRFTKKYCQLDPRLDITHQVIIEYINEFDKPYDITLEQYTRIKENFPFLVIEEKQFSIGNANKISYKVVGYKAKAILDRIEKDDENKSIRVIDYKTTSKSTKPESFGQAIEDYGYDFQGAFYLDAVQKIISQNYPDYTLEKFMIVVESTMYPGSPRIYEMSDESRQEAIKKIKQTEDDMMYYILTNQFKYNKKEMDRKGVIPF